MSTKIFIIVALLLAGGALAVLAFGNLGENLVYYWTPSELVNAGAKAEGATVRLGGMVKAGTVEWNQEANDLKFEITDGGATVRVHARSVPPAMFREGIGVVVEGTVNATGVFESERLMVKHDNQYQAPENGQHPDIKELMKSVEEGGGT